MFSIPTLPSRALSSNGSKRNHHEVSAGKMRLGADAYTASHDALGPNFPHFEYVDIFITFYVKHRTRNGDGLYRPLDPSNIGGECIKPIIDYGVVKPGIIDDDDYKHVRWVGCHIENVSNLNEERMEVRVIEVVTE